MKYLLLIILIIFTSCYVEAPVSITEESEEESIVDKIPDIVEIDKEEIPKKEEIEKCVNECTLDQKRCIDKYSYSICDYTNECTEWSDQIECKNNHRCNNGKCIEKKQYIEYNNPIEYHGTYQYHLQTTNRRIHTLYMYAPVPREWDSQKDIELILYNGNLKEDPVHNNKFLAYDINHLGRTGIKSFQEFKFTAYEINTDLEIENIQEYDKESDLYQKYTESEDSLEADYFKTITPKVIKKETDPVKQAQLIYDYIIDTIHYSSLGDDFKGAVYAYEKKRGECGEYASLFVAMARSVGIPARPVTGFWADPVNGDVHVWAEFYVEDVGWIPVDPQQGEKKRDYYFGNLDNERLIMAKNFNIQLDNNIANIFQVGAYWWWGSGNAPHVSFEYDLESKK